MKEQKRIFGQMTIIKGIIFMNVCIISKFVQSAILPVFTNNQAIMQMNNSADSSAYIQLHNYIVEYIPILLLVLFVGLFYTEIKKIVYKIKEKMKNEEI